MSRTKIYFVETPMKEQRMVLCRWVERFYEEGRRVQVACDSTMAAQHVDQMLWSFSQESFIPHCVLGPKGGATEPVVVTAGEVFLDDRDILICDVPMGLEFMKRYPMSVHFVIRDDVERRQASRLLWQEAREGREVDLQHVPYA